MNAPSFQEKRNSLILAHVAQVRFVARRIRRRLPAGVCLEDLISAGILGLIAAVDNFDCRQRTKLHTYAEIKIRGAILDSLRALDWAPRLKRRKAKEIERVLAAEEQRLQRPPTEEEMAAALDTSLAEYRRWLLQIRGLNVASIGLPAHEDAPRMPDVADREENLPSRILERAELEWLIDEEIETVPAIERNVLKLYYREGKTAREIGRALNLKPDRVFHVKKQAVTRLRAQIRERLSPKEVTKVSRPTIGSAAPGREQHEIGHFHSINFNQ